MAEPGESAEGFLGRWSRLKREARTGEEAPAELLPAELLPAELLPADIHPAATVPAGRPQGAEPADHPAEEDLPSPADGLPPLDSLDAGSDYTGFLRREVPEELRRQALRKAWSSDPVIAGFRGFAEYDWDFNAPGYGALRPTDDIGRLLEAVLPSRPPDSEAAEEVAAAEVARPETAEAASREAAEPLDGAGTCSAPSPPDGEPNAAAEGRDRSLPGPAAKG